MTVTIELIEKVGHPPKVYPIKDFDELTLLDWRNLTVPKIDEGLIQKWMSKAGLRAELDITCEMLSRHTGIAKAKVMKLLRAKPPEDAEVLINTIGETLKLAMEEGAKQDESYRPPMTIEVAGKTLKVAQDLERDTVYGQWADLSTAEDFEDEVDVMLRTLAILLTEEGKPYSGDDVGPREKLFLSLKMIDVFPLTSFFFDNSERFKSAVAQAFHRYRTSTQHRTQELLKTLSPITASISKSGEPPSSSPFSTLATEPSPPS